MAKELVGVVVNPKKRRKKRSSRKKRRSSAKKVRTVKIGRKKLVIISNPAHDQRALLEIAAGAAAGLAGGKLLDRAVFNQLRFHVPFGISLGDVTVLTGGLLMLKKGGRNNEFATGVVAGAGAKIVLNLVDSFLFKNRGVVSLHGEDYVEPYELPDELIDNPDNVAELGEMDVEGELPGDVEEIPEESIEPVATL